MDTIQNSIEGPSAPHAAAVTAAASPPPAPGHVDAVVADAPLTPTNSALPPPRHDFTPVRESTPPAPGAAIESSGGSSGSQPVPVTFGSVAALAAAAATTSPRSRLHPVIPPVRKDTASSISTIATEATVASTDTNNTSYSADTSPTLHQSIFSIKDGSDVSNTRRASRRRTGPLSQQSRERAALIRKLGACPDCRRRRVACNPGHHHMSWEDVVNKFRRAGSPTIQDIAPSLMASRALSPSPVLNATSSHPYDSQEMEIDSGPSSLPQQQLPPPARPHYHHQQYHSQSSHSARTPLSEARIRTPLPSGPRLEKSLSLPGIETLKNELQTNVSRMLSGASRTRYNAVNVLLLLWQDDDDAAIISGAVEELADVLDKNYHYTVNIQAIPSSADGFKSSTRWLSRQIIEFAEDRDHREVLKILYYAGHTYLDSSRQTVLASSRDAERATTVRWSGIQQTLEDTCSDTLILMDAAYFPCSTIPRQRGILEIVAASTSEDHYNQLERGFFTRTVSDVLKAASNHPGQAPLSAAELHSTLFAAYWKMVRDPYPERKTIASFPTPFHVMMSGNSKLPSIYLGPAYLAPPLRSGFAHENSPQLHFEIRLNDDHVDVESWLEWLRLMPEGARDIKVEGPFRSTFR